MINDNFHKYLFHYTKMATVIEYILNDYVLKFSKLGNLNDPWENRKLIITIWQGFSHAFNDAFFKKLRSSSELLNETFYKNSFLLCFSLSKYRNEKKEKIRDGYNLFRMWAQYADRFKGVCLVFNRRKLINKIFQKFSKEYIIFNNCVRYIDIQKSKLVENYTGETINIKSNDSDIIKSKIIEHIIENNKKLYFTKDTDWEGENEYRVVLFKKENCIQNEIKVSIKDSLESVILGCNLNKNYIPLFKEILHNTNVQLYRQNEKKHFRLDVIE